MPTYQYVCTACDQPLEAVQSFSDAALTECPACGGRLRKVYGAVGVVFKGSGFYKTDSRDSGKKADAPAAKSDGASSSVVVLLGRRRLLVEHPGGEPGQHPEQLRHHVRQRFQQRSGSSSGSSSGSTGGGAGKST